MIFDSLLYVSTQRGQFRDIHVIDISMKARKVVDQFVKLFVDFPRIVKHGLRHVKHRLISLECFIVRIIVID